MYTQCPECGTAFRVTAEVLKVAAGKVRCGGCANAFNALEYLSEEMPEQKSAAPEVEPELPELKPESPQQDDSLPESISAEQSAALLKTLDELAGSDIRIEDTGVEWRLLDDDDEADAEAVDEVLEDSPTPVEELRFDDNTPLPEDFGFEDPVAESAPVADPEPEPVPEPETAQPQPDITLSDPHEWTDILDEFEDLATEVARPLDAELDALLEEEEDEATRVDELVDEEPVDEDTSIDDLEFEADEDEVLEDEEELDEEEELDDEDPQLNLIEDSDDEEHDIEAELTMVDEEEDEADDIVADKHYVPPMTEEEQTVNMQIDQELLAIAVEDDDGFASTIIIPEDKTEEKALEPKDEDDDSDQTNEDEVREGPNQEVGFETIIMEGAEVKGAIHDEKWEADVAEAAELQAIAKTAEAESAKKAGSNRYGMIAGIVILAILLIVQIIHQSREALATNEVFNNTIGPIYRALGKPLLPSWDITGWQFEATRGSAEIETEDNSTETSETLTVYSRIGNNSEGALPYPLIRISLTDRFEEPLGSHVLEPNDYLGDNMDPRKLVQPGESFEAAITVASPSEEATSFRLDVCYRHSDHQLRCKDDNFK